MYIEGTIIYFTPFYFPEGNSKNKYFLVLANNGNEIVIANLPTSKNHIPDSIKKLHGCIIDDNRKISCYLFEEGRIISECGTFGFPKNTYVYGEQIDFFDMERLHYAYKKEGVDYIIICKLSNMELKSIKECFKNSAVVSRKFKKFL